jgi:hypothetical protein
LNDAGTRELASLLAVDSAQVVRALGGGWRGQDVVRAGSAERWFVSGEPPQVAVGFDGFDFMLARPAPRWDGVAHLDWRFDGHHRFQAEDVVHEPDALARAAEAIATARRRSFRWCRTCRRVEAPEAFLRGEDICMTCAALHHGYVF